MSIKIMLDSGHYANYNRSPVVPEYWESRRMWVLCNYLEEELKKYGFQVLKTRSDVEKDVPVYERGKMAKGCDLFISLHSNACDTEKVNRVDVYGAYDNLNNSHDLAKKLAVAVAELMAVSGGYVKTRKSDDGDDEYYGVLRGARHVGCPLFYIIEHSFHTNEKATRWLLEDKNLKNIAKLEAEVIAQYYGVKPIVNNGNNNANASANMDSFKCAYLENCPIDEVQKRISDMNKSGKLDSVDYIVIKK